jgi:hypothetical protein
VSYFGLRFRFPISKRSREALRARRAGAYDSFQNIIPGAAVAATWNVELAFSNNEAMRV